MAAFALFLVSLAAIADAGELPSIWELGTNLGHVEVRNDIPGPKEFFDTYVNGWLGHPNEEAGKWKEPHGRVVLFKGAAKRMPAWTKWSTDELLLQHYAKVKLDQVETEKVETRTKYPHDDWLLEKFIKNYNTSVVYSTATPPKAMQEDVYFLPMYNCGGFFKKIRSSVLWWSSGGTKSVIHNDGGGNQYCLFSGKKKWTVWHPTLHRKSKDLGWANGEEENKNNPDDPTFQNTYGEWYAIDYDALDTEKFPGWKDMQYYTMDMEAGDCAYIPHQWLHHVDSFEGRSMAVHAWVDAPQKFDQKSCDKVKAAGVDPETDYAFPFAKCSMGFGDPDLKVKKTGCKLGKKLAKEEL